MMLNGYIAWQNKGEKKTLTIAFHLPVFSVGVACKFCIWLAVCHGNRRQHTAEAVSVLAGQKVDNRVKKVQH